MAGELVKAEEYLKIGQRVEFYVEADEARYTSRVEDITEDTLEVAMPMTRTGVPIIPRIGEKLYGVAVGNQCRFRFFVEFLKKNQVDFENSMPLDMGQLLSIPFVIIGVWYMRKALRQQRN